MIQSDRVIELFVASPFFERIVAFFMDVMRMYSASRPPIELNFVKLFVAIAEFAPGQDFFQHQRPVNFGPELFQTFGPAKFLDGPEESPANRTGGVEHSVQIAKIVVAIANHSFHLVVFGHVGLAN